MSRDPRALWWSPASYGSGGHWEAHTRRRSGKATIELAGDRDRGGGDREDVADDDPVPAPGDDLTQAGTGGGFNDDEVLLSAPCAFPAHGDRAARSGGGGDVTALLMITPPLPSTAWVEIVAAGQSAQARVAVPLHLRQHRTGGGTDVV